MTGENVARVTGDTAFRAVRTHDMLTEGARLIVQLSAELGSDLDGRTPLVLMKLATNPQDSSAKAKRRSTAVKMFAHKRGGRPREELM